MHDQVRKKLTDDILTACSDIEKYKHSVDLLDQVKESLDKYINKIDETNKEISDIKVQIEDLSTGGIKSFIHKVTGQLNKTIENKNSRIEELELKLRENMDAKDFYSQKVENLSRDLKKYNSAYALYECRLEEKRTHIRTTYPSEYVGIGNLMKRHEKCIKEQEGINSILPYLNMASEAIENAREHLDSAQNWSTLDIFGGGMVVSAIKRSSMNEAQFYIEQIYSSLNNLNEQLNSIAISFSNVEIDNGLGFADVFFDNFFVDRAVHKRILESVDNVAEIEKKLYSFREDLINNYHSLSDEIVKINDDLFQAIVNV